MKIISFVSAKTELERKKKDSALAEHFKSVEKFFPGAALKIRKETIHDKN